MKNNWQCRVAPSLGGGFAGTPQSAWGTGEYTNDIDPTCFFGLYGLPDFYTLWRHRGRRAILWAGSDILHLKNGYWLDKKGEIRLDRNAITKWISKNCENWCENLVERDNLLSMGIKAKV